MTCLSRSLILLTLLAMFANLSFGTENPYAIDRKGYVLVTIPPYQSIVEKIAGETIGVRVFLPSGVNLHSFEPTPKQVMVASNSDAWFRLGEVFEERAVSSFKSYNPKIQIVDLRKGLDLIKSHPHEQPCEHGCTHSSGGIDLHYWLSPKQMKIQAETIAKELMKLYPEHSHTYHNNLQTLLKELDMLDDEIETILAPLKNRILMVSHPSFAYYCRDYNLAQLSIEFEGRDPTPKQLTKMLEMAKNNEIRTIFTLPSFNNKGATIVASEIGARLVELNPLQENYILMMRGITSKIASKKQ